MNDKLSYVRPVVKGYENVIQLIGTSFDDIQFNITILTIDQERDELKYVYNIINDVYPKDEAKKEFEELLDRLVEQILIELLD